MTTQSVPVGGELDAWCTRCERDLNHVVVSKLNGQVKRVECRTCGGQHVFRPAGPRVPGAAMAAAAAAKSGAKTAASPGTKRATPRKRGAALVDDGTTPARDYRMTDSFRMGDYILHPSYGRGRVLALRGNKIDVQFTTGPKTLAHEPKVAPPSIKR